MRVLPILFNGDMVRAILDGRKTVTRRVVKNKYSNTEMKMRTDKYGKRLVEIQRDVEGETYGKNEDGSTWHKLRGYIEPKPPYQPGDTLYVRETWQYMYDLDGNDQIIEVTGRYVYAADGFEVDTWVNPDGTHREGIPWHPSIHMPKAAARIWLKVTDVRVERLKDMCSDYDNFLKEGLIQEHGFRSELANCFKRLWNSTIKKSDLDRYGWDASPWVWVIEFERCEKPEEV